MQHSQETAIHEIFLRASSATKKSAPLKLHAHVIGKFSVERELSEGQRERVRESTQDAANQRNSRTTLFIEPLPTDNPRKRKEPQMFRKPLRPADKLKAAQVMPTMTPASKNSAIPSQAQRDAFRKRLLHYLALGDKTEEQVHKHLGGPDRTTSPRREIQDLLVQLAEPVATSSTDKSPKFYRLKLSAWTEVRPYEWPALSEPEQATMARSVRTALHKLGISNDDPLWRHAVHGAASSNPQSVPSIDHAKTHTSPSGPMDETFRARKQEIAKRGVTSNRETKERKTKPKTGEIMMKDESLRAVPRTVSQEDKPNRAFESRRIPETSFNDVGLGRREPPRVSTVTKPQISNDRSHSSSNTNNKAPHIRHLDKDVASPARRVKTLPIQDEKNIASTSSLQKVKKNRPENEVVVTDLEGERRRVRDPKGTVDEGREEFAPFVSKRKATDHGKAGSRDMTPPAKRRKSEHLPVTSSKEGRTRDDRVKDILSSRKSYPDPNLPEKPQPSASSSLRPKKKHESPPPLIRHTISNTNERMPESSSRSHGSGIVGSQTSKSNASAAPSRTRQQPQTGGSLPNPAGNEQGAFHSRNNNPTRTLPTDHAALRARYNTSYLEYLAKFQRLVVQRGKIDHLLKNNDIASTMTDSEGDCEILDAEELAQLAADHRKLQGELETIQQMFGRGS
ncbi:hypothetical protein GALMADRAFT_517944 [Galerina marginata CBS 339.88]|uniref:RNA polymerase II elongation factor ELL N-terminal domain-containing protein n=1 Tax=Galerina marginata (strain CBS 339.88) TaxID=685588 RepID=A0A067T7U4_GALM3|nr:hypothetical protein GALMADRAFT_517944 [Galerina marginata CBS 339.88]